GDVPYDDFVAAGAGKEPAVRAPCHAQHRAAVAWEGQQLPAVLGVPHPHLVGPEVPPLRLVPGRPAGAGDALAIRAEGDAVVARQREARFSRVRVPYLQLAVRAEALDG